MKFELRFRRHALVFLLAAILMTAPAMGADEAPPGGELGRKDQGNYLLDWVQSVPGRLAPALSRPGPPFSFIYGGMKSHALLRQWPAERKTSQPGRNKSRVNTIWT